MNRVVLCGRLESRPKLTYTPCGKPVATFRLRVPRTAPPERQHRGSDLIDCLAFGTPAVELYTWGEAGCPANLEGRLRAADPREAPEAAGLRVLVDHAYRAESLGETLVVFQFPPGEEDEPLDLPASEGRRA